MGLCEKISWSTTVEDIAPEPFSQHKREQTEQWGFLEIRLPYLHLCLYIIYVLYVPVTETY